MSLVQTQRLFHDLCFSKKFSFNKKTLLKYTDESQTNFLLTQDQERHLIYRELLEANIFSVLKTAYPILFSVLDDSQNLLRDFLHHHKARDNFYRHCARDFLDFIKTSPPKPFLQNQILQELADYEWSCFDLNFQKNFSGHLNSTQELPLEEARLVFNPNLFLKDYGFPVHKMTGETKWNRILPEKSFLLIYRHPKSLETQSLVLNKNSHLFLKIARERPRENFRNLLEFISNQMDNTAQASLTNDALFFLKLLLDKGIVLALTK